MRKIHRFSAALLCMLVASFVAGADARAESWTEGSPMTTARAFAGGAVLDGDLYVIGGDSTSGPRSLTEIYDFKGNIWRAGAALPKGNEQFGVAVLDDKLYVAGGLATNNRTSFSATNDFWVFDKKVGVWVDAPKMPEVRMGFGLVAASGKLYAIGGKGPQADRVFVFDPRGKSWSVLKSPMPAARQDAAYAVVNGLVYVMGGYAGGAATARVDIFNPADGSWRTGPSLPAARRGLVTAVVDGKIHVTGGESLEPSRTYPEHFVLSGGSWTRAKPLPTSRHGSVAAADGNRFFVIGGSGGAGVFTVFTQTDVVEIYTGK